MSEELKACPFCAAKAELVRGRIYAKHSYFCILHAQLVYDFKQTTWNSRPIEDALRSKLAVAVEALDEVCKYGCGILCEEADGDHHHLCPQRIAKEALAKIH